MTIFTNTDKIRPSILILFISDKRHLDLLTFELDNNVSRIGALRYLLESVGSDFLLVGFESDFDRRV